jgi:leucyl aminopeptidase
MKAQLSTSAVRDTVTDLLVLPVFGADPSGALLDLDALLDKRLVGEVRRQDFRAREGQTLLFQTHGAIPAHHVLLVACGSNLPSSFYQLAHATAQKARDLRAESATVMLRDRASAESIAVVVEGITLSRYRFDRFRSRPEEQPDLRLTLAVSRIDRAMQTAAEQAAVTAEATCYARDLVNTPAAALTPEKLAGEALRLKRSRISVRVHKRNAIARMKMGALLGVAKGSEEEPCFIEMAYRPTDKPRRRVALAGKGITFDSGGLSLKKPESMQTQKRDMAGAAVVLGVMHALRSLAVPVEVRGYIPACENMPSGRAMRPGDVVQAVNGKTIEVLNTDAEGRLVLADALAYAVQKKPDVIIDLATLTAAVTTALGSRYAAILGTDKALVRTCIEAGAAADEKLWELPLAGEYRGDIDSTIADIKNVGEGQAGTIIGALFLREFVGDVPWAHIDFSSTVMTNGHPCHPKGATGFGVRTILNYLRRL